MFSTTVIISCVYALHSIVRSRVVVLVTQIQAFGPLRSRHLTFLSAALAPTSNVSGSSSRMIWSIENRKPLVYLYESLAVAPQTRAVGPEPKFQALASDPTPYSFWLWLQPSKITWAPAPQLWQKLSQI